MIDIAEEFDRLTSKLADIQSSSEKGLVVQVRVQCPSNAEQILDRVRGILAFVIRHRIEQPNIDQIDDETEPFVFDTEYWREVLPAWFLERTPFEDERKSKSGWSVESWLFWFLSGNADRAWRWLSASTLSSSEIEVLIQVNDLPLPWDALRWAFLASGAESVKM